MLQSIAAKSALLAGVTVCGLVLLGAGCKFQPPKISDLWNRQSQTVEISTQVDQIALDVSQGRIFTIELVANETTGYRWTAQHTRPNIEFVKDEYIPNNQLVLPDAGTTDGEAQPIAGAGGTHYFTFSAIQHGYAQIIFSYARSWEEETPLKQVIYDVNVK